MIGVVLALPGCSVVSSAAPSAPVASALSPRDPADYAAQIVRETNRVRAASRLPELGGSTCAEGEARQRAEHLVGAPTLTHAPLAGVIAHCRPDTTAAENLSRAAATPAAVIGAWLKSPGHRSNLLDPTLTEIGVGCVLDGQEMLCSQVFLGP